MLEHLSQQFTFKTRGHLHLPYAEDELQAFAKIPAMVKRHGPDLTLDALKKTLGL